MVEVGPAHLPASAILAEIVEACGQDTVSVDWIICRLSDRSFGVVLATLGVLSLIPGAAILAGLLLLYPGVQMAIGRAGLSRSLLKKGGAALPTLSR